MLSSISSADEAIAQEAAPPSPAREFPILRSRNLPLAFGVAPLSQYQGLVRRLNAEALQCVYLLLGEAAHGPIARGGRTGEPLIRLATHLARSDFRHFKRVAMVAGRKLTEDDVKAFECLLARQIAAVNAENERSKGPEMVKVLPCAWNAGLDAFLFLRWALSNFGITFLEPASPQHPAAYWACKKGIRDRWAPGAFDFRKTLVARGSIVRGPRLELDHGDFITVTEKRGEVYSLLAGSEIRATPVSSARKSDRLARLELINSGRATHVRGYPDRLELLVDLEVGYSLDKLTKFVFGNAGGPNRWRPLESIPSATMQSSPLPTM